MANFKICVFEHQLRSDGKYPVSIRVYWKKQSAYIGTEYKVTDKQINKKTWTLKDTFIINDLNKRISKYEDLKSHKLGLRIELYTAKELAAYFQKETKQGSDASINFIEFSRGYISKLKSQGRNTTAGNLNRTINAVVDFCNGRDRVSITEVTYKFLEQFETYLRSTRTMKRKDQFGREVKIKRSGVSDVSVFNYMTDLRVLFNAAMDEFNDEDKGEIRVLHYPFRKYKLRRRPANEKRNISKEQIVCLRDIEASKIGAERAVFARDVFMLSFYLIGMNLVDMYEAENLITKSISLPNRVDETIRIEYNRKKTKGRRQDRALISIKVEPEAMQLFEKYRDKTGSRVFDFYRRYTTSHIFSSNVNKGLKVLAKACEIKEPLSTYYARHSWATIARNKCNVSKDDIDLSLNHVDQSRAMADFYIEKDWSRIDNANREVINYLQT